MVETKALNPNSLARQSREQAVRQIEESYKNSLNAAAKARENAVRDATAAKAEAVKQAQAALERSKKRLSEARDRIEARLRKQELDQAKHTQKQMLIKAEDARVKALKQAEELGKHLAAEAAAERRRAIQQAYDDEKKMKLEAKQTSNKKDAVQEKSKLSATPDVNGESEKTASASLQSVQARPVISRKGIIKLIIAQKDVSATAIFDFETQLRNISDIRLLTVSGTNKDGVQLTIYSENSVSLPDKLRQLPIIEEIIEHPADILIKLKPAVIFEGKK